MMPPFPRPFAAVLAAVLVGGIASAGPALSLAGASPNADLGAFHGAWERVAAEEDDESRMSAIEVAVAGLSWLTRKMAAPILRATTSPPARYEFVVAEQGLRLGQRGEEPRALPLDGTEQYGEGPRGEFRSQSRIVDGSIETQWVAADARGSNRYTITDGGDTLLVEHTIEVTALDGVELFAYQSRFQRTPGFAAGSPRDSSSLFD